MSLRPPRKFTKELDPLSAALEAEVLAEKAGTLARLGTRLEHRLARLREFEECGGADADRRAALLAEAGEALWHVVIQRELCGLRNSAQFYRDYCVPRAVILRMGPNLRR
ncbi:DUF6665 family protein [Breoghania sp. L-A4]|uniref:DUF6665 family protein n=1 Tax=Breoghania sp. L-A4 TaxID=2304600 RepID=UPI000E35CBE3|nr:DUF6665 family protein [Breoghania sp. L-A4]AXS42061.1 hypothetical protein D1F64_21230 [Breoghania sp. L-A4]